MLINFIRKRLLILVSALFLVDVMAFGICKINSACACSVDLFDSIDDREEFYMDKNNSGKTRFKTDQTGYKYAKYKIYKPNQISHPMYKIRKCLNKSNDQIIKCEILLGNGFYGLLKNFEFDNFDCYDKGSRVKVKLERKGNFNKNFNKIEVSGKIEHYKQKFDEKISGVSGRKLYFEILEKDLAGDLGLYEVTIFKNNKFNEISSKLLDKFYIDLAKLEVILCDKFS